MKSFKIAICYPPLPSPKGVPLLSQNRQFQWFHKPTFIYPMVPAYAASLLSREGYDVAWLDGIAEQWSPEEFAERLLNFQPDVVAFETKTPAVKTHWEIINRLKWMLPDTKFVLMGDHVTALPEESLNNCPVDYVLTGGDFDFALLNLANHLHRGEKLAGGFYFWHNGKIENTGHFELKNDVMTLPRIDRDLTRWDLYAEKNGNYKYLPGTYTMVGRDCWWGKCSFCSWTVHYTNFRTATPERLLDEVGQLIEHYGVREIFDDTGTFPAGKWLEKFCLGMVERGYHKQVTFGCNMIPGVLSRHSYDLMGKANFRFVLYGVESANEQTQIRLNKKMANQNAIAESMRMAKSAGLEPHVTCMVGYPWETSREAQNTIDFTKSLFEKGYIDTLQATIVIPYPGTPLFKECQANGGLKTEDWDRYDMREPIMKTALSDAEILALTQGIYKSFLTPKYLGRKLLSIRKWDDVAYYARAGRQVLGHLMDFSAR